MATYTAETDVLVMLKDLINDRTEWDHHGGSIPKPKVGLWNELGRQSLKRIKQDIVVLKYGPGGETQEFEGHALEFKNYTARIEIEIVTTVGRQRLMDIKAEIRRIINRNQQAMYSAGYQIIRYVGFVESPDATVRNWRGTVSVEMESHGVSLDTA